MEDDRVFVELELDDATLARYVGGEVDSAEREWVEQIAAASEVGSERLESARAAWAAGGTSLRHGDVEAFLAWLRKERQAAPVVPRSAARVDTGSRVPWLRISLAGAVLVLLGVVFARSSGLVSRLGMTPQTSTVTTYATANGQRANISLPDGSRVVLGVASQLLVPTDFARGDHTLRLSGEALFTVAHHEGAPFTVVTDAATTRVLGTTFMVRRYATDTATVVAVRDGKVAVQSTVLTAQQQVAIGRTTHVSVQPADAAEFSFATGVLTLDAMTLAEEIPELDRWYDADIRLGNPTLAKQGLHGKFAAGSLGDLVALLEAAFDVRVVRDGKVLTLYPKQ